MVKNGGAASIFTSQGDSVAFTDEAMTRVGSTPEFYITSRTSPTDKSWWDPAHVPTFKIGGVLTTPTQIDYAAGMVTFASYSTGAVTCSGYYFVPENLGGGFGFDVQPKSDKKEVTTFPAVLNDKTAWKKWIATLSDWTATINRHYFYGRAWVLLDCTNDNSDLIWACQDYGDRGNLEQVKYEEGGALAVARVAGSGGTFGITTVTFVADSTTAAQIKAHVEADPAISSFWAVSYSGVQTGAGKVNAKSVQTCSGGRDHSYDIARLGKNVLVRLYLDVQDATREILSGVGIIESVPQDVKLEDIINADITLQGVGRLKYHTV
jgi:hypothetical protein